MLQRFVPIFQRSICVSGRIVASVFIWILHTFHIYVEVFYLDITYICNGFQVFFKCFRSMFQVFHLSFFMLQVLHLDVSKVDRTSSGGSDFQLCFWPPRQLVAAGRPRPSSSGQRQLEAALKRCLRAAWACEMAHEADCRRWRLDAPPVRTSSGLIWSSDAFRRFTI